MAPYPQHACRPDEVDPSLLAYRRFDDVRTSTERQDHVSKLYRVVLHQGSPLHARHLRRRADDGRRVLSGHQSRRDDCLTAPWGGWYGRVDVERYRSRNPGRRQTDDEAYRSRGLHDAGEAVNRFSFGSFFIACAFVIFGCGTGQIFGPGSNIPGDLQAEEECVSTELL